MTGEGRGGAATEPAADTPPADPPAAPFDGMHLLAAGGEHDLDHERWNAYAQFTLIGNYKAPFSASYTSFNRSNDSLLPTAEGSYTGSATLFLGARLWRGSELYEVPELISERPLSGLTGLGGTIQNFELQKNGTTVPKLYMARLYLRQTFALGDETVARDSGQMQLGAQVPRRRLVFIVGNYSLLDFFDRNSVEGDPRRGMINMAFITNSSYDFAADARGYTWGGIAELYFDDWAVRFGRAAAPYQPNQPTLDFKLSEHYGDQVELEHTHTIAGVSGTLRVLGFRNREYMGRFADAIALYNANPGRYNAAAAATQCVGNPDFPGDPYGGNSANATAPDLCWARRNNVKMGIGVAYEQHLTDDLGFFVRAMYSDGKTEVYSYTSADRSVSAALLAAGSSWHRPRDVAGVGYGAGWISSVHAQYLGMGGIDGFIGDGKITQASEQVVEGMYSVNVAKPVWISLDYQHIWNPAFNAARGPVEIAGARLHAEF